jgi:hypothetical protein
MLFRRGSAALMPNSDGTFVRETGVSFFRTRLRGAELVFTLDKAAGIGSRLHMAQRDIGWEWAEERDA